MAGLKGSERSSDLSDWTPPPAPGPHRIEGRYVVLERLSLDHAPALHRANSADDAIWDWLPYGPFEAEDHYRDWMQDTAFGDDPIFYAIRETGGDWAGVASYLRINPAMGSIELGHINLSTSLQKTRAASEAFILMIGWAFEAGYRRFEWKCDAANLPSRRAAERLGLSYEGVFRQAGIVKGRNRDTAWFATIDAEWPALQAAYDTWLDPANFDGKGRQVQSLGALTTPIRVAGDPALR